MLRVLSSPKTLCNGVTRREVLEAGGTGLLGLSLSQLLASPAGAGGAALQPLSQGTFGRAKHCIVLFLYGAPSQLETFDPKPDAPVDIRGPFQSISTALPGVRLSEHLPRIAAMLNKTTLVRSLSHDLPIHGVGYAMTGVDKTDVAMELNRYDPRHWPTMGSVLEYLGEQDRPGRRPAAVPNNIHLPWDMSSRSAPHKRGGTLGGFLGSRYNPVVFEFQGTATKPDTYRPNDPFGGITPDCRFVLGAPQHAGDAPEITLDRLAARRRLLTQFDDQRRHLARTTAGQTLGRFQEMAFSVMSSPDVQQALDLKREPDEIRARYGHHLFGQSALLARRMIEAGSRLVSVYWDEFGGSCGAWDTHEKAERRLKTELCPGLDQTFTALIEDLEQRGLLDETLVVCMGEHGRTPQPERRDGIADGRGHWSRAYSGLFAGGGIAGGRVVGETDGSAAEVRSRPVSPKDILRTIYHLLGVDAERMIPDKLGRPLPLVAGGDVVHEMLG